MTPHTPDLDRLETEHRTLADALASIRLFHAFYGSGSQTEEWIGEVVRRLRRMGQQSRANGRPSILTTGADAIARTYLGRSGEELEWPNPED